MAFYQVCVVLSTIAPNAGLFVAGYAWQQLLWQVLYRMWVGAFGWSSMKETGRHRPSVEDTERFAGHCQ